MATTRRVTFRLYPTKSQTTKLHNWRRLHCYLYNAALSNRRTQYQKFNHSVDYFEQQNCLPAFKEVWPEFKELGSHALQGTLKRVDFAYNRFLNGLAKYPRFKAYRRYKGWTYPCKSGWKALTDGKHGRLRLTNIVGEIRMRGQARTWGTPTTCTILFSDGKWYASITVRCEPVRKTGSGAIGIDFGINAAASLSDGTQIPNPRFLKTTLKKVRKHSKKLRRKRSPNGQKLSSKHKSNRKRTKPSSRWKKIKRQIGKVYTYVANRRADWAHKVAAQIVDSNSLVATEKLNLKGMTKKAKKGSKKRRQKTGLNRSLLDVGIGMLRDAIAYKLDEANGVLIMVPTLKVNPSQTCPQCGHQRKKILSERVHQCQECGCTEDRDVAAAKVMLQWALGTSVIKRGEQSSTVTTKERKNCGSMRQLGSRKRQKRLPAIAEVGVVHIDPQRESVNR